MPFDPITAKKTIAALQAHQRHPGGELMLKAATALEEAVADAGSAMAQIRGAEAIAEEAKKKYDSALLEIRDLRPKVALGESAVVCIRAVAAAKKGAPKIAADWLAANNLAVATEAKEQAK